MSESETILDIAISELDKLASEQPDQKYIAVLVQGVGCLLFSIFAISYTQFANAKMDSELINILAIVSVALAITGLILLDRGIRMYLKPASKPLSPEPDSKKIAHLRAVK